MRRDALVAALRQLPDQLVAFVLPAGGLALWVQFRADIDLERVAAELASRQVIDLERVAAELASRQVILTPGSRYYLAGPVANAARLGYTALTPQELAYGVAQFEAALCQYAG